MKTRTLKQLVLYNYRYIFGYSIIVLLAIYFLGWRLGSLVPGLAPQELVATANHVSLQSFSELPLAPLHGILQYIITQIFGFSAATVRLPSVLLAAATMTTLYFLLKKWFGRPTALMGGALIISADWFLHFARFGTGSIEFSFWVSFGLLSLTKVLERKSLWLLSFALAITALLFVPFGPYASLTLLLSLLGYKVFRGRMHEVSTPIKAVCYLIVLLGLSGAIALSVINIEFAKQLLVIQDLPTIQKYFVNIFINTGSVVAMLPNANPIVSTTSVAVIRFFELIFILFGVAMLFKTRVNRLNLTAIILSVVLVAVSGLSGNDAAAGLMIVPTAIFMTAGIRHLIHRWKRTFPNNPYARIMAYMPLAVLFICVVLVHYVSYFRLWASQTDVQQVFSVDSRLAVAKLNDTSLENKDCFVETDNASEQAFISASQTVCRPIYIDATLEDRQSAAVLLVRPASPLINNNQLQPSYPLVSTTRDQNVRWLVVNHNNN